MSKIAMTAKMVDIWRKGGSLLSRHQPFHRHSIYVHSYL